MKPDVYLGAENMVMRKEINFTERIEIERKTESPRTRQEWKVKRFLDENSQDTR